MNHNFRPSVPPIPNIRGRTLNRHRDPPTESSTPLPTPHIRAAHAADTARRLAAILTDIAGRQLRRQLPAHSAANSLRSRPHTLPPTPRTLCRQLPALAPAHSAVNPSTRCRHGRLTRPADSPHSHPTLAAYQPALAARQLPALAPRTRGSPTPHARGPPNHEKPHSYAARKIGPPTPPPTKRAIPCQRETPAKKER